MDKLAELLRVTQLTWDEDDGRRRMEGQLNKLSELLTESQLTWDDDDRPRVEGQLNQLKTELMFLVLFWVCLETWESDDEQCRTTSESTITAIRLFWAKKSDGLIPNRLIDTWPVDVQAFLSIVFAVNSTIQQSKLHVEQWCEFFLQSPSMRAKVYEEYRFDIKGFLSCLRICMRATEINRSLNNRLAFLDGFLDILDSSDCCIQNDILLRGNSFALAFVLNASCLACLYWAKEATGEEEDIENADEMNNLLLNMFNKFIPYAPDVIIIISQNLHDSSDSIVISTNIATIVDIFFMHLGDDFQIL